jgi:hypothetical protein
MIPIAEALQRVRGMFLDVQGTRLSGVDAARLSGIDRQLCGDVLEALVNWRFLKRGPGPAHHALWRRGQRSEQEHRRHQRARGARQPRRGQRANRGELETVDDQVDPTDLRARQARKIDDPLLRIPATLLVEPRGGGGTTSKLDVALEGDEKHLIEQTLADAKGRVSGANGAAARLGVPASTLESKIKRFNIDKLRYRTTHS